MPHAVRNRAPPITARSTFGSPSVTDRWWLDKIAWPMKNDPNDVISPMTRVTTANTTALAANTTPRRGCTDSVVRIIPVEYSEVMVSAPSTAMTSWPTYRPARLCWVASKLVGLTPWGCDAVPAQARAPMPTQTTMRANRVQYVDRVDLILVNSDRSASPKPARPVCGGSRRSRAAGAIWVVAISGHPRRVHAVGTALLGSVLLAGSVGVELDAVGGQFHERFLQRGLRRGKLVQPDPVLEGQVSDLVHGQPLRHERAADAGHRGPARLDDQAGQDVGFGGAHPDRLDRVALDELGHAAVGDQPAPPDHQQVVRRVLHLRHQVTRHENRAPLAGKRLHEVPDPQAPLGVQDVDGLVEHEDGRAAEQRRGDAEPLAHAEREALGPLLGHVGQAHQVQHLPDAPARNAVGLCQAQQVVVSATATVDGLGVQQRADLVHRVGELGELLAVHAHRAAGRPVQAKDQPHRRRLARAVGAEETGDPPGLDGESQLVHGQDRKSTRLNSSHVEISYAVFCLKKKK